MNSEDANVQVNIETWNSYSNGGKWAQGLRFCCGGGAFVKHIWGPVKSSEPDFLWLTWANNIDVNKHKTKLQRTRRTWVRFIMEKKLIFNQLWRIIYKLWKFCICLFLLTLEVTPNLGKLSWCCPLDQLADIFGTTYKCMLLWSYTDQGFVLLW